MPTNSQRNRIILYTAVYDHPQSIAVHPYRRLKQRDVGCGGRPDNDRAGHFSDSIPRIPETIFGENQLYVMRLVRGAIRYRDSVFRVSVEAVAAWGQFRGDYNIVKFHSKGIWDSTTPDSNEEAYRNGKID
jgi:hypothetical protein